MASTKLVPVVTPSHSTGPSPTRRQQSSARWESWRGEQSQSQSILGQVSGGGLAVLDSREEREWLRSYLTDHVVGNICNMTLWHFNNSSVLIIIPLRSLRDRLIFCWWPCSVWLYLGLVWWSAGGGGGRPLSEWSPRGGLSGHHLEPGERMQVSQSTESFNIQLNIKCF